MNFLAIDFQLADNGRDSACSISLVKTSDGKIIKSGFFLIRPPRKKFRFSGMHGITWNDVKNAPDFGELWPEIEDYFRDIEFITAFNYGLDRSALQKLCEAHSIPAPDVPFRCAMQEARKQWDIYPTKLENVCDRLNIELNHNHPAALAEVCAQIMMKALEPAAPVEDEAAQLFTPPKGRVNVRTLGSTSSGNSTLIWNEDSALLVDCGLGQRYTEKCLTEAGLKWNSLSGVLITHVHDDHTNGHVINALSKNGVPIYCSPEASEYLAKKYKSFSKASAMGLVKTFTGEAFIAGSFRINPFPVPHDAHGGCYGFNVDTWYGNLSKRVTIATDIANADNGIYKNFVDSDVIVIESNHDVEMLHNSGRPWQLIKRIRETGHLSNDECAGLLKESMKRSTRLPSAIVLAHISQDCNTNAIAEASLRQMLTANNYPDTEVVMTFKNKPNDVTSI